MVDLIKRYLGTSAKMQRRLTSFVREPRQSPPWAMGCGLRFVLLTSNLASYAQETGGSVPENSRPSGRQPGKARETSPAASGALLRSFETELGRKDRRKAQEFADEFLRVAGDDAHARSALGLLYAMYECYGEAAAELSRAHALDPADYDIGYNLALALFRAKRYSQSIEVTQQMVQPQDHVELHPLLCDVYEEAGKDLESLHECKRALELDPANEQYWFNLSYELLRHRTYDGAITVLGEAVRKFPRSSRLFLALGVAYFGQLQADKAVEAFAKPSSTGLRS